VADFDDLRCDNWPKSDDLLANSGWNLATSGGSKKNEKLKLKNDLRYLKKREHKNHMAF
jgi:hypothetical protein